MLKKSFKLPIINGLLAIMMMLGTFSAAYAQGTGTQVLLPLIQTGASVGQPVDGPFFDVPEPPAFDEDKLNSLVLNEESMPEISAAGSCLSEGIRFPIYRGNTSWVPVTASQRCRDLNVRVLSGSPCYVYVNAEYWSSRRTKWVPGSRSGYRVDNSRHNTVNFYDWYSPITDIPDGTPMRVSFYVGKSCSNPWADIAS